MRSLVKIPLSSLFLVLVACGGGGATGSGTPAPDSTPSPAPTPPATGGEIGVYLSREAVTFKDAALTTLNDLGAQGYAWVSDLSIPSGANGVPVHRGLYVRNQSTPTTYRYTMVAGSSDVSTWLETANAQGQLSRLFKGPMQYYNADAVAGRWDVYVERANKSATFEWLAVALPGSVDLTTFANTLNTRGESGYAYRGLMQFGTLTQALFVRDSARPGPFRYRLPAAVSSLSTLAEQLSDQAAAGYRYLGPLQLDGSRALFQQEQGDPWPVRAKVRSTVVQGGEVSMLEALNGEAASGNFYQGDLALTDASLGTSQVSVFSGGTQPSHPLSGPVWP